MFAFVRSVGPLRLVVEEETPQRGTRQVVSGAWVHQSERDLAFAACVNLECCLYLKTARVCG